MLRVRSGDCGTFGINWGRGVNALKLSGNPFRSRRLLRGLKEMGGSLLDLFFPKRCAGCEDAWLLSHEGSWCNDCLNNLPWIEPPLCPQCGRPFVKSPSSPDHLCGECLSGTFFFDSARSANVYTGVIRERIHQLKFGRQLHRALPLAQLLVRAFEKASPPPVDFIVPVPLHIKRLRERGFNQSGLLAGILGHRLHLPVHYAVLLRRQWTKPQTRLKRRERLKNVGNAFEVSNPSELKDCSILLVDDVYTTGTTLNECAKVLKSKGAGQVHALTVARVVPELRKHSDEIGDLVEKNTKVSSFR